MKTVQQEKNFAKLIKLVQANSPQPQIDYWLKVIPQVFIHGKINEMMRAGDFQSVAQLAQAGVHADYVQLCQAINSYPFEKLIAHLDNPQFTTIIHQLFKQSQDTTPSTGVCFKRFSTYQNKQVALKLLEFSKSHAKTGEVHEHFLKTLYCFDRHCRKFIKEFVLEHMAGEVFWHDTLHYRHGRPDNMITEPYTAPELTQALSQVQWSVGKAQKMRLFFEFFRENFFHYDSYENIEEKELQRQINMESFLSFAQSIKDSLPIAYVALSAPAIYQYDHRPLREKEISQEELGQELHQHNHHQVFLQHFDIEQIRLTVQEAIEQAILPKDLVKNLLGLLHYNHSYEIYSRLAKTTSSNSTMAESAQVFKLLFCHHPDDLIHSSQVGCIKNFAAFIRDHGQDLACPQNIQAFLTSSSTVEFYNTIMPDSTAGKNLQAIVLALLMVEEMQSGKEVLATLERMQDIYPATVVSQYIEQDATLTYAIKAAKSKVWHDELHQSLQTRSAASRKAKI